MSVGWLWEKNSVQNEVRTKEASSLNPYNGSLVHYINSTVLTMIGTALRETDRRYEKSEEALGQPTISFQDGTKNWREGEDNGPK